MPSKIRFIPGTLPATVVLDVQDEPHLRVCGKFWRVTMPVHELEKAVAFLRTGHPYEFVYEDDDDIDRAKELKEKEG